MENVSKASFFVVFVKSFEWISWSPFKTIVNDLFMNQSEVIIEFNSLEDV